jgi:uncharacterized membrane protein/sporulation protein YlmC with PRC-barrel domain
MEFPINVDVICTDGQYGKSTAVIVDPATERVSHIAVSDPERMYTEYLVPVREISGADNSKILLQCTKSDVEKMDKFAEADFLEVPYYGYSNYDGTFDPMAGVYRKENLPEGKVAITKGMAVEAVDGHVGIVDELVIDQETGGVTHIVMRSGHIWGNAEVSIPVDQIKEVDPLAVYLDRDKDSIKTLPVVQIRRHYSKEEINQLNIEIVIWAFDTEDKAKMAMDHLLAISKEKSIDIRNVAILEKDADGNTKAREIADLGPRRGGITGVIAGGLIGLLVGPGGALLGATAGAITGRAAAKKIDRGFSRAYLSRLEAEMKPRSSGIVTLLESNQVKTLIAEMDTYNGVVYRQKITDGIVSDFTK